MTTIGISALWESKDPCVWKEALCRYWDHVRRDRRAVEDAFEHLDLNRIKGFTPQEWYEFLRDEYFFWKFTAANRYETTKNQLRRHFNDGGLDELDRVRQRLLAPHDLRDGLATAKEIHGLATIGASGLLAVMHPTVFATVDQFVLKALQQVADLPEAAKVAKIRLQDLSIKNAIVLIEIMQRQAAALNCHFGGDFWTSRKVDQVLWTYGR